MFGNHVDGGYAEYILAPAKHLFAMPEDVPLIEGSVIADAVTTPYHAVVNRAQVKPGDQVVVFGCGGIGINVVQMAAAIGARVIAIDLVDEKLAWASKLGAAETINPTGIERIDKTVRKMTDGGAHIAFEAIGLPTTQKQAFACPATGWALCRRRFRKQTDGIQHRPHHVPRDGSHRLARMSACGLSPSSFFGPAGQIESEGIGHRSIPAGSNQ